MATIFDDLDTRKQSKGGGTVFDDLPTSPAHPATPSAAAQEAPGAQTMPQAGMAAPMPLQPASEPPAGSTPQPIASHKSVQTQSGDAPKDESHNIFKNPAGASKESIKEQYQSSAKLLSDNLQAALQPGLSPVTQSARAQAIMGALGVLTAPLAPGFGLLENAGRTVALAFLKRVAQGDVYKKMVEKGWIDPKSDKVNLQNIGVLSGPDRPSTGNVAIDLLADIVTPLPPVLKGARAVKGLVKAADKTADVAKVADKAADVAKAADNAPAATVFDDLVAPEAKPAAAPKPVEVAAPAPEVTAKPVEAPVPEPIKAMEPEPTKPPEAAPAPEIRYRTDYRDYHDGQHDGTVYAYDENGVVQGKLDFSIYQGKPKIQWVEVADDRRRKGIGRELVNQLQKEVPEAKIEWGMTTPEGTALRKAIEGDIPAAKPSKKAASSPEPKTLTDTSGNPLAPPVKEMVDETVEMRLAELSGKAKYIDPQEKMAMNAEAAANLTRADTGFGRIKVKDAFPETAKMPENPKRIAVDEIATKEPEATASPAVEPPVAATREPWQMSQDEYIKMGLKDKNIEGLAVPARHPQVVEEALRQGKNVPDEVLKDYPELRPKAPEAAVSTEKAPKIEAYSETERPDPETGEPGTLRKEWRVRITGKKAALKIREEFSYPPGKFYLESRYIKNGKEEPWKIVTTDDNYDSLVASIDSNATPVTKRMQGVQEKWRKRRTESEKREAAKKANEEKAREEKQIRDNSEAAFRRMAESPNPRFRQVAKDWIAAIERLQKDAKFVERAHDDAQFRAEYDAVLKTTKVPEKAKAMREFLAKLPQYEKRFKGKAKATKAERPAMAGSVGSHVSSRIPPQIPAATGPAPKPVRQTTQSVAAPPGSALAEAEQITSVEPKRPSALQKVRALPKALQTSLTSEFTPLRQLERNVLEVAGKPVPQVDLARKFEQVAGAPAQAQADVIDFRRAVVDPVRDIADDFNTYLFLKRTASRLRDNPDVKKVGDWTVEKAEEALAQMKGKLGQDDMARLEAAGEAYQIEMDKALRLQVETGRMTQEMYDKIKASNDFYARFKVMKYMEGVDGAPSGTGRNIANTQDLTKAITGIEEEDLAIGNILQASAEQIVRSRILAEKNRKMLELDALLEFDADGTFIKRAQPTRYYRIETDTAGELLHQLGMQETSRNPQLLEQSLVKVGKAIEFAEQVGLKVNRRKMQSLGRGTIGGVEGGGRISLNAFTSDTMAHELGHTFDTILRDMNGDPVIKTRKVFGVERDIPQRISSEINAAKRIDPKTGKPAFGGQNEFQKELAALVDFTGLGGGPKYRSSAKERFAEFISLYIHDPKKAKELAPTWTAHFEREILPRNQIKSLVDRLADFYRKVDKLPNIKTRLKELDDNDYLTLAIRKAFPASKPQIGVRFGTKPRPGNEIVTYFKNGKEAALEVSKEVAEAIQGANAAQTGLIAKAMAITKTPLQWGATGANAAFQVRNLLFADLPRTALMSRYGIRDIADIYRFPADWAYSFFTSLKGNFGKENDLYMAWLRSGAANSTIQRALTPTAFKATLGLPERLSAGKIARIPKEAILDTIAKFSSAIEETSKIVGLKRGMRFENITTDMHPDIIRRRMEYVVSEVRNYSGSPDFLRRGRDGQNLNLLFMFFNARVQGNIADIQRLAGKTGKAEARAAWMRIGAAIGIPATLLSIVNHSGEYAEHYQRIPRWERDNYFMIPNGKWFVNEDGENVPDYWRIPKREITKLFGNMIDSAVEFAAKADPEALGRFAASVLENISPVNIEGETGLERLESVVSSLNPIIKTPVELASGRDTFRHYDVTPQYMEGAPTEEQYRYSTPKPFVAAGQSELAKALGLSPLHLEMLARSVTAGGLTQFTARKPEIGRGALAANPITRMFYRSGRLNNEAAEQAATKAEQKETAEQVKRRREAERMVREWQENGTGDEQKRKAIAELRRSDPKLAEKVRDLENARAKGIDNWDRRIATLGVESGARAEYIVEILKSLKSKEERDKYLAELRRKKLLTPKVYGQVRRQMQKM